MQFSHNERKGFVALMEKAYQHLSLPIINCALELNLFDALTGYQSVDKIRTQIHAQKEELQILLDALVALDLLHKKNGRYKIKEGLERFLDSRSDNYIGPYHRRIYEVYKNVPSFANIVKTGEHPEKKEKDPLFFRQLVEMMFTTNIVAAAELADFFDEDIHATAARKKMVHILDVGSGSGVWSLPFAQIHGAVKVDALDFEKVLEITRKLADRHHVLQQYAFLPGDMHTRDWPKKKYDFVIFGNICNTISEASVKTIFTKARKSLVDEGKVLVVDMVPEEDLKEAVFPVIFSILMRLITSQGTTHSVPWYEAKLQECGFKSITSIQLSSYHSKIIIGRGYSNG